MLSFLSSNVFCLNQNIENGLAFTHPSYSSVVLVEATGLDGTISASPVTVCQNGASPAITFTGSGGIAPYTFGYKINGGAEQTISTTGSNTVIMLPAPTNVSGVFVYTLVNVTDATTATQNLSGTATVTIKALPVISGNLKVCAIGSTSQLTSTDAPATTSPWVSSSPGVATVNASGLVTAISVGTATITFTNNGGCSSTAQFVVGSAPIVDFSFTNNNVCSGTALQFNPSVTGTAPFTYKWDFGDSQTSTDTSPSHVFTSVGCGTTTFKVTLTVADANGCTKSKTTDVNVIQKPDIDFVDKNTPYDPYNFSNCSQASATNTNFTVTVDNNSASKSCIKSYSVDWGDGATQTTIAFPITHTYTQLGSFKMTFSALGNSGCTNSKTYIVKNVSNPKGGIISPGSTTNLCAPSLPVGFVISSWGMNSPGTTYNVNFGDNTSLVLTQEEMVASTYYNASNPDASQNYPIPHIYTTSSCPSPSYTVTLNIINSCGSTPGSVSNIIVMTKPVADFTVPVASCANSSVTFTNTTILGYAAGCNQNAIFKWDFGDGTPVITTPFQPIQNTTHTYTAPGTYTATLTARNVCDSTIKTRQVCIEPALVPKFSLSAVSGCAPLSVTTKNETDTSKVCKSPTFRWSIAYSPGNCGTFSSYLTTSGTLTSVNPTFSFKNPGTYSIRLTATNSCGGVISSAQTVVVSQPPTATINTIADICGPGNISPTAVISSCTSATTPTYLWSFPGGNPSSSTSAVPGVISYASIGTYTASLTVTNECGASATATKTFNVNAVPKLLNTELAQTVCSGLPTDSIPLKSDITSATYSWTATATTGITGFIANGTKSTIPVQTILNSGSTAGTVTYSITPKSGTCTGTTVSYIITIQPAPKISSQPISNSVCKNAVLSPLSVTISNFTGTPNYQWYSNSANSNTGGVLISGETNASYTPPTTSTGTTYYYCVISLGAGGCSNLVSNVAGIIVNDMPEISAQTSAIQNICVGGSITLPLSVSIKGGAGLSYQWFSSTLNQNTGGTKINVNGTSSNYTPPTFNTAGNYYYYVEISFTGNGCGNMLVSNPMEIDVVNDPVVSSQPIATQTLCQGGIADSLKVSVSGGIGIYSYHWYKNTVNNTNTGTALANDTTLAYYIPSTGAVGTLYYYCKITQPTGPNCSVTSNTAQITVKVSPTISTQPIPNSIVCKDANSPTLSVTIQNAIGIPTYQWYSNTNNKTSGGIPLTGETNQTLKPSTGTSGTNYYYCVVTLPTGGCSTLVSDTARVVVNSYPVISDLTTVICSGNPFLINPTNTGGNIVPTGTTYTWTVISPPSITGASTVITPQSSISQTLINSTSNPVNVDYNVIPIAGVCSGSSFKITVTVNPSIIASTTKQNITCYGANNGQISTSISGGIPFGSGLPYNVTWSGPNGFSSTSANISGLTPGVYLLTILDQGGCPFTKNDTIFEPTDITLQTDSVKNITCFGLNNGEIALTIKGGTLPYKFIWTKDGNSFPAISNHLTNLALGIYNVSISDKNNCGPKTATFTITEPPSMAVNLVSQTNNVCFGDSTGTLNVMVSGGTKIEISPGIFDYIYSWTGPYSFKSKSQNLTDLKAGTYTLIVTDKAGCTKNADFKITEGTEIKINAKVDSITCYGADNGSITLQPSGGTAPYQIDWSNLGTGLVQNNLSAGEYVITVTDFLNCVKVFHINIPSPPVFTVNPVIKQISCFGANDGSIKLNFVGGKKPVKLVWSDNSTAGTERNNIGPGTYIVTITDGTPCEIKRTFIINEPQQLIVTANIRNAFDCNKANSGAIQLLVAGGTTPIKYSWSNGAKSQNLDSIPAGNYMVTVTDSVGCSVTNRYEVVRQQPISIKVDTLIDFNCTTKKVKEISTAHVNGGFAPYTLTWSNGTISGTNNEIMETTQNGLIILQVVDSKGCEANYTFNTYIPTLGISYQLLNCNDHIIQFNAVVPNEKTVLYNYQWSFGDNETSDLKSPQHTFKASGSYSVQLVVTGAGCSTTYQTNVLLEASPVLSIFPQPVFCQNDSLTLHVTGAKTYKWSDGTVGDSLKLKQAGDYNVIGTSLAGCTGSLEFKASYFDVFNYVIQSDKNEIVVDLSAQETTVQNTLHFSTEFIPNSQYYWDFGDGFKDFGADLFHTFNVLKDGYFEVKLTVINPHGCVETATKRIWIKTSVLPNSFSPNGDGKNDVFLKGWRIQVYNRNGILLFDGDNGWDGTFNRVPVSSDTYYYVLYYTTESGTKTTPGFVTIIR